MQKSSGSGILKLLTAVAWSVGAVLFFSNLSLGADVPNFRNHARAELAFDFKSTAGEYSEARKRVDYGRREQSNRVIASANWMVRPDWQVAITIPYVTMSRARLDGSDFIKSPDYARNKLRVEKQIFTSMIAQGLCLEDDDCRQQVEDGQMLLVDEELHFPTGETVSLNSGIPLRSYVTALSFAPEISNSEISGIGDPSLGMWYRPSEIQSIQLAVGGAIEFALGRFSDVPSAQAALGQGIADGHVLLSAEAEDLSRASLGCVMDFAYALESGVVRRGSMLSGDRLNAGDPTTAEAVGAGSDARPNVLQYERPGVEASGKLLGSYSLFPRLLVGLDLTLLGALAYEVLRAVQIDGVNVKGSGRRLSGEIGVGFNQDRDDHSVAWEFRHQQTIAGRNADAVAANFVLALNYSVK